MSIIGTSKYRRALWSVDSLPAGRSGVYQLAFPFQLSATEMGVCLNIRQTGIQTIDLEIGNDLLIIDHLNAIDESRIQPLNRCEISPHPRSGKPTLFAPYPSLGGFVPHGALREDGTPHPHAGSGFAVSEFEGFPPDKVVPNVVQYEGAEDHHFHGIQVQQHSYDGSEFRILKSSMVDCHELLKGHYLHHGGLTRAIADGDDLLQPFCAGRNKNQVGCGVLRWRRLEGEWRPVAFTSVTLSDKEPAACEEKPDFVTNELLGDYTEPSLVRDFDGSLLFTARAQGDQPYAPGPLDAEHVKVWRSTDHGQTWEEILHEPHIRALTPMTINRAVDGTIYLAANPARINNSLGQHLNSIVMRETIMMWPLSDDRRRLLEPIVVRDTPSEFGKPPHGSFWRVDHPVGLTVRLSDGKWHHIIGFRGLEHNENDDSAPVTSFTGSYLEEVFTDGPAVPTWRFADEGEGDEDSIRFEEGRLVESLPA